MSIGLYQSICLGFEPLTTVGINIDIEDSFSKSIGLYHIATARTLTLDHSGCKYLHRGFSLQVYWAISHRLCRDLNPD